MIALRGVVIGAALVAGGARAAPVVDLDGIAKQPPAYVVTDRTPESIQFVDVGRVLTLPDGTRATHDYVVLKSARQANGLPWTFGDLVVQYDCRRGTITVRSGLLVGEDFKPIGSMRLPGDGKRWLAADDPDVARTYGYPVLCHSDGADSTRVGAGRPWQALAASLLADLRSR